MKNYNFKYKDTGSCCSGDYLVYRNEDYIGSFFEEKYASIFCKVLNEEVEHRGNYNITYDHYRCYENVSLNAGEKCVGLFSYFKEDLLNFIERVYP